MRNTIRFCKFCSLLEAYLIIMDNGSDHGRTCLLTITTIHVRRGKLKNSIREYTVEESDLSLLSGFESRAYCFQMAKYKMKILEENVEENED